MIALPRPGVPILLLVAAIIVPWPAVGQETAGGPPSIQLLEARVDSLRTGGDRVGLGRAWLDLAEAFAEDGRHDEAVAAARAASEFLSASDDPQHRAAVSFRLGNSHWLQARYDSALVHLGAALALWDGVGDLLNQARVHNNIGTTHYQLGNYELALEAYLQALRLRRDASDPGGEALALANIGLVYHDWGQLDLAGEAIEAAVVAADASSSPMAQGYARQVMGQLHLTAGEMDRAETAFREAADRYEPANRGSAEAGIAAVLIRRGRAAEALPMLEAALDSARAAGIPRAETRALLNLGRAYRALDEPDRARGWLVEGLGVARSLDQRPLTLLLLAELAELHTSTGATALALESLRAHDALRDSVFDQAAGLRIAAMEARSEASRRERENLRLQAEQLVRDEALARERVAILLGVGLLLVSLALVGVLFHFNRAGARREALLGEANRLFEARNEALARAISEVRTLKGFIPICSHCKKVRTERGFWEGVESYVASHSDATFSHAICSDCGARENGDDRVPREPAPDPPPPSPTSSS
jgi:tetratricopeptide (TPR) repeat protein